MYGRAFYFIYFWGKSLKFGGKKTEIHSQSKKKVKNSARNSEENKSEFWRKEARKYEKKSKNMRKKSEIMREKVQNSEKKVSFFLRNSDLISEMISDLPRLKKKQKPRCPHDDCTKNNSTSKASVLVG